MEQPAQIIDASPPTRPTDGLQLDWLINPALAPDPPPATALGRLLARLPGNRHRQAMVAALLVMACAIGLAWYGMAGRNGPGAGQQGARKPGDTVLIAQPFAPAAMRPLDAQAARAWNRAVPVQLQAGPSAASFMARLSDVSDYQRSLACLTAAVYYEAGNEPADGQIAVAQVVLNRVRHPAFPNTVCGVVFQGSERSERQLGCQFSFTCDGSLRRKPNESSWARARAVADAALHGQVFAPIGWATHYHADYVVPYWAASLVKVATVGAHIFYRSSAQGAFTARYRGGEPAVAWLGEQGSAMPAAAARPGGDPVDVAPSERPVIIVKPDAASASASAAAPAPANAPANATPTTASPSRWIVAGTPAPRP